ncbi:hypothetical protein AYI69_g521 [Smittium culicis]|uniref:Uncharacterized protein n=1 Tax=Smittium culicis TaxID=133412 RepID=A0A1R1YST9_9FUNG|nr:hypothetical protein AYI69_g521 [Smittium culicis]
MCKRVQSFHKPNQSSNNKNLISSYSIKVQSSNAKTTAEATSNLKISNRHSNFRGEVEATERGPNRDSKGSSVGGRLDMFRSAFFRLSVRLCIRKVVERGFRIPFKSAYSLSLSNFDMCTKCISQKNSTWCGLEGPTPSAIPSNATYDVPITSTQAEFEPGG